MHHFVWLHTVSIQNINLYNILLGLILDFLTCGGERFGASPLNLVQTQLKDTLFDQKPGLSSERSILLRFSAESPPSSLRAFLNQPRLLVPSLVPA